MVSSVCAQFHYSVLRVYTFISGDYSREVTPVPISNTVVKLSCADDTWREAAWESRTLPGERDEGPVRDDWAFVLFVVAGWSEPNPRAAKIYLSSRV